MIDVAIVGLGSWGLSVLERAVSVARSQPRSAVRLHVIEPGAPGGVQYSVDQPDYLVLNNACGQLSLYAAADHTHPDALGLFDWAVRTGYRWVGEECRIDRAGRLIEPTDYLPRRLMGEYLAWFYDNVTGNLPRNLELVRHHERALDIIPVLGNRETVLFETGRSIVVDHVILTSGHTPNRQAEPGPGEVRFLEPYPIRQFAERPAPGAPIAVAGMGLVAYDLIAALTTGRDGVFRDLGDRKKYLASGREPVIVLYSRSGVPHCAKSASGIDPTGDYRPVVCTPEVFAAIRNGGHEHTRRSVDFRREVLPLLFAEMQARYHVQAAQLRGGKPRGAQVREMLHQAWLGDRFDMAVSGMERTHGRFDPTEHLFAGDGWTYASSDDYERHFYDMLERDLDESLAEGGSPVKAAQEVLRILRDDIRTIIEYGGLSLESYIDLQSHIRPKVNRLEAGPPPARNQQLLALMDAGIVRVPFGPNPTVALDDAGLVEFGSAGLDRPYSGTTGSVIRGHLDMPSLAGSASPLLSRLYRMGRLTQLSYGDTPVGSVAIDEQFHPYDMEGRLQRNLSLLGVLTEGSRYFTHYLPSPNSRLRAVYDARDCVESCDRLSHDGFHDWTNSASGSGGLRAALCSRHATGRGGRGLLRPAVADRHLPRWGCAK